MLPGLLAAAEMGETLGKPVVEDGPLRRVGALHSVTKKTILLFKERCRALIAAAVTGQIDVEAAA